MIVRTLDEVNGSPRDVSAETWRSRRLLLAHEGMGFSLHDTLIRAGTTTAMHYKHHLEAVYCIEGRGSVTTMDGTEYRIEPGTVYALDQHEEHVLLAETELRLVCVFNPPLVGPEVHDDTRGYPLLEVAEATPTP